MDLSRRGLLIPLSPANELVAKAFFRVRMGYVRELERYFGEDTKVLRWEKDLGEVLLGQDDGMRAGFEKGEKSDFMEGMKQLLEWAGLRTLRMEDLRDFSEV